MEMEMGWNRVTYCESGMSLDSGYFLDKNLRIHRGHDGH